ncbi:MAG: SHOCT domain-containing protein [Gammaproteobacteria bacterium]|nr:SHOCT domain-containing protein [Gammaproteobacteria bacterium]
MSKFIKNLPASALAVLLLLFVSLQPAYPGIFGDDEDVLWKSGINLYIKLDRQDKSGAGKTPPNDHPVTFTAKQLTDALISIAFWEKEGFFSESEANTVFTISHARILGNYLSQGLARAKPDQDIVFALSQIRKGSLGFGNKLYMAGRVFYHDNRLHVIIGDYDRPADKGLEAASGGAGVDEIQYFFTIGSRTKSSPGFKKNIITGNGIEAYTEGNKRRRDWFMIDVPAAAAAYVAKTEKKENPGGADAEAIRLEAAKLAKERREMRAEMAKMRKEMNESLDNREQLTIEERLAELDELHKKNLITDAEYDQKRKEILDDI